MNAYLVKLINGLECELDSFMVEHQDDINNLIQSKLLSRYWELDAGDKITVEFVWSEA